MTSMLESKLAGLNEIRVLRTIFEAGPISRAKVARRLNLSRAAVTLITQKLVKHGLLTTVGKGASTERGGRREVLLAISPRAGFILAAQLERNFFRFGLLDSNARHLDQETQHYALGTPPAQVLDRLIKGMQRMLRSHRVPADRILGMGVGLPGILDYEQGCLREAYTLQGWQDFPVQRHLSEALAVPVHLENDVKAVTLGEFQFGTGRLVRDLICLWVEDGIGAGIIVNGQLLRGATSSAGEIGYNELPLNQAGGRSLLITPQQHDWGDILSHSNLKEAVARGREDGWATSLPANCEVADIIAAAESGDPLALHLLKDFGRLLGTVCVNLIYAFNPPLMILHGPLFYRSSLVADEVRAHAVRGLLRSPVEAVDIRTGMLGENAVLVGAATLVLENLFKNSPHHAALRSVPASAR
ncbi:MAG: ROK family transcriptional regulator [candidate division KSB1 bacterium]|nr:ROK family transcriptional regulator [candidate division KSB1 bacterium]MDZ7276349.1 ROK family transcriptional regulator [candidate division KSB1 bacterium]MDZ7287699.1 ROK family transcriptional regulator [candidate division KSB1 bacterium]MDZ7299961.1 ROK family transcriptional regulator [candidate division KSB1 bacterium]MDZ7305710.1 ROK family transcriptional regulator [candidate division KSB1 bacterium]